MALNKIVTASVVLWTLQPGLISFLAALSGDLGPVSKRGRLHKFQLKTLSYKSCLDRSVSS